ncbi:hypothetical protein [Micromonospora mirobrigensis]|uniref:Uncharacterized protein n=1 Tax=Micromonospora mirobrigensis TaxID=262898 RepID=A0A1C4WUZ1_9ACTN|nr:hypothetical protein [Micromonospora mirobrigensis]SCF00057.1 hypothetical protein GA0070564_102528 [Micromonospora mirobrigensis]
MSADTDARQLHDHAVSRRGPLTMGVLTMIVYGLAWLVAGVTGLPVPTGVRLALSLVGVVTAGAVLIAGGRLRARGPGRSRRVRPHSMRWFHLVNVAQTVAILVAVLALLRAGAPGLIVVAVCLVVGAHFLPLARIFDVPGYWWTGGLLILVAAAGAAAYGYGATNATVRSAIGLPAAVILWATALEVSRRG